MGILIFWSYTQHGHKLNLFSRANVGLRYLAALNKLTRPTKKKSQVCYRVEYNSYFGNERSDFPET